MQVILDGTDSNAALITARYAHTIIADYSLEQVRRRLQQLGQGQVEPPVRLEDRVWFNPDRRSAVSFVPGVVAMVVMLVSLQLTALSIVRERRSAPWSNSWSALSARPNFCWGKPSHLS